jgi:hypothetical protein
MKERVLSKGQGDVAWHTPWYALLLLAGAVALAVLALALAGVGALTAAVPGSVAPRGWTTMVARVDEALADGDRAAALSWWREAQAAALRSGQWEGMVEVGDAARRLGEAHHARRAYLTALFRARRQHSLDGVLAAAAGFGALGDREVLAQALRIAERQAGTDPRAQARVRRTAQRWRSAPLRTERHDSRIPGGLQP